MMEIKYDDIYPPITPEEIAKIPEEMRAEQRWICWGSDKIPVSVVAGWNGNHFGIAWEKPDNWGTFSQAIAAIGEPAYIKSDDEYFHIVGIGFVVGDGWFCADLDGGAGHNSEDVPETAINDAINTIPTYMEKSVSGCGYHIFGKCNFSTVDAEKSWPHRDQEGNRFPDSYAVEFFTRRKFIAITGRMVPGSSASAADCTEEAFDFYNRYVFVNWKIDEAKQAEERKKKAQSVPVNADDATKMFLLNYPEILAASDSSHFKRGSRGGQLAPGEYSWIAAVKAMQEIGIPEDAIMEWCRRGSNFKSEKDVRKLLDKPGKPGAATVAGIIADAKTQGWRPDPDKLTGEYKAKHEASVKRKEERAAARAAGISMPPDPEEQATDADAEEEEEGTYPEWLIVRQWQGREIKRVNEPMFAQMFINAYKVNRINSVFYLNGEYVQDDYVLKLIQDKLALYFMENTGRLTNNVMLTVINSAHTKQPEPDETKIYCHNNITINVNKDGSFDTVKEEMFTLTRIGADYVPGADCPTFIKYLDDLFFDSDIPAVQEYIGYCLIPCTRAQAGLFIKGKGGEGKSVLRDVSMALFGHAAIQEKIHQLGERFTIANLENKLVVVDDDLETDHLSDTGTIKKLITARQPFQVERKLKTKYDAFLYTRIIAIGNTFIGSKFDHSDGFYRRQLLIDVKPKTRDEKDDDRYMSDKCIAEISGILNWALVGLARLIKNGYHFTVSDRMKRTLDGVKHDGNNLLTFIEDDTYIEITKHFADETTSADLFMLYAVWCRDNNETLLKRKTFQVRMSELFKDYKTRIRSHQGKLQGYYGIRLTDDAEARLAHINDKEREWIMRLP